MAMDEVRGGNDLVLMTFGAILVTGALRRSTNATTAKERADVLNRFRHAGRTWRRRGTNARSTLELVAGATLVAYALLHGARSVVQIEAIGTAPNGMEPTDNAAAWPTPG